MKASHLHFRGFVTVLFSLLLLSAMEARATNVAGVVRSDTRWTVAASPYVVVDHLTVAEGVTLTIDPGVLVQVAQFVGIWIEGSVQAAGTQAQPIRITGTQESAGWWRGMLIVGAGSAVLEHCDIGFAGYWEGVALLKSSSGSLALRRSVIRNSSADGLRIAAGSSSFVSAANTFLNNARAVHLGIGTGFDDPASQFIGNNSDVFLDGGTLHNSVTLSVSSAYSVYLADHYTIALAGKLTVAPGTVLKIAQFAGLWVNGSFEANGSASQPVFITDPRDDSVGGDMNRDGSASAPSAGYWRGVFIEDGATANLTYTTLRYAGYWDSLGLRKKNAGTLSLANCSLTDIAGRGMLIENNTGTVTLSNTAFRNSGGGLELNNSGQVLAEGCSFTAHANHGILQQPNDALVYANNHFASNAWGSVGVYGGTLTNNSSWTLGQGPDFEIVLRSHFNVAEGVKLTVSPGVTVRSTQFTGLYVRGTLEAIGTPATPIRFLGTIENAGWHRGILVLDAGSAHFEHCDISHGGYWESVGLLKSSSGSLVLKRSSIRESSVDGLRVTAGSSAFVSEANLFRNNARGVHLGIGAWFDDPASRFESNGLHLLADGGTIANNVTWNVAKDYAVLLGDHLTVAAAGKLTLAPGTILKMPQFVGLWVNGRLEAQGTSTQPVYITASRDDTVGGDTNGDGAESSPAPGWWRAINIENDGAAGLTNTTIRFGGYWDSLNLRKSGGGALALVNCTVSDGSSRGMLIENNSGSLAIAATAFQNNGGSGLQLASAGTVAVVECVFRANGNYGILQQINDSLLYSANRFADNAWGSVGVNNGVMDRSVVWTRGQGPVFDVVLRDHVTIGAAGALTIDPGVAIRVTQFSGLFVQGSLRALGSPALPIRFSGTTESTGWWRGILLSEAATGVFENCEIAYSGYWDSVGLAKSGSGSLSLKSVKFAFSSGDGLRIDGSTGAHEFSKCSFVSNQNGVLARNMGSVLNFTGSRFESNKSHGVLNQSSVELDARQSWWGSASGPRHSVANPNGQGDPVSDRVLFEPWLNSAPAELASLTVAIEPAEARSAGAAWSIDGAAWQPSGAALDLAVGSWTVQFKPLAGWIAPTNQPVTVAIGQSASLSGTYSREQTSGAAIFTAGPDMAEARMGHNIATLADGRVVLFGGHGTGFVSLATAEVWSTRAEPLRMLTMRHTHDWPAFARLPDGRLLLAGGSANLGIPQYAESEIFDPASETFTSIGNMVRFRSGAGAAALSSGNVLIAGAWWTHNDAHTYGELGFSATGQFAETKALNQRRAYPLVLPADDGQALVIGGVGPNGEAIEQSVESFNPADGSFTVLRPGLFPGETGWSVHTYPGPVDAQRMSDGRFLLMAYRAQGGVTEYTLFTFDPSSKAIEKFATEPALPTSDTLSLWPPAVDAAHLRAILLAQVAGTAQTEIKALTIDLVSRSLAISANSHRPDPPYALGGAAVTLLQDGRLFVTGGTADGSNFNPVRRTLLVTPAEIAPPMQLRIVPAANGRVNVEWPAGSVSYSLEQSSDLKTWSAVEKSFSVVDGWAKLSWEAAGSAQFFRLRGL